ncbi:MAG: hypothetical protein RIE08_06800 [Acidimicrobiales bacterium]
MTDPQDPSAVADGSAVDGSVLDDEVIAEILAEAAVTLPALTAAGQALVWVSGALGLWRDDPDVDVGELDRRLLAAATDAGEEALVYALGLFEPSVLAIAVPAAAAAASMTAAGSAPPRWAVAGVPGPQAGWAVREVGAVDSETVVVTFGEDEAQRYALLCDIDGSEASAVRFGPDPIDGPEGLLAESVDPSLAVERLAVEAAAGRIAAAVGAARERGGPVGDETLANLVAAADHLARAGIVGTAALAGAWPAATAQSVGAAGPDDADDAVPDVEADRAARDVLRSALRHEFAQEGVPTELATAAGGLRDAARAGTWPGVALVEAARSGGADAASEEDHAAVVLGAAGVVAAPYRPIGGLDAEERRCLSGLEWADWLGAVIGIVRAGAGAPVTPEGLVDSVNRCPEVTTSIAKADRAWVASGFSIALTFWEAAGLVVDGRSTPLGVWALPRAFDRIWTHDG